MKTTFITYDNQFNTHSIEDANFSPGDYKNLFWVDIQGGNRGEALEVVKKFSDAPKLIDRLSRPGTTFRLHFYEDISVLDVNVGYDSDGTSKYGTFIFFKDFLVTIRPMNETHVIVPGVDEIVSSVLEVNVHQFVLAVMTNMLDYNARIAKELKSRVDHFAKYAMRSVDIADIAQLQSLKDELMLIQEIFDDQLTTIELLPGYSIKNGEITGDLERINRGLQHLQNNLERAEDKLDDVYQRYHSDLQKKTNKRLNTLTLVQSIFVPMTFIAGIYGMNFVKMPELQWENGYFYALGAMGIITILQLYFFYRNGWFDSEG